MGSLSPYPLKEQTVEMSWAPQVDGNVPPLLSFPFEVAYVYAYQFTFRVADVANAFFAYLS